MRGGIVPHAPLLLLPQTPSVDAAALERVRSACARLAFPDAPVVIVSPHGRRSGVYGAPAGDLEGFGLDQKIAARRAAGFGTELAAAWGAPVLDEGADHGCLVPLALLDTGAPVAAVALAEDLGPGEARAAGSALADALARVAPGAVLLASAHGSAALSPRAPLTERPRARRAEQDLIDALGRDVAAVDPVPEGSCGAGPLAALARWCAGRPATVLAHEAPAGVGYIVASVS